MSQSTITEKRTVISSSSNVDDALADIGYKPSFGSRASNIISRSVASPLRHSTGGSSIVRTVEYGYGSQMGGFGPGGYSNVSSSGVNNVKSHREQEKKDMRDLNERFANYIEKVRFLEAQNKKLGNELDELRSKWGKETTHIKTMYEAELAEARKLIDDLSRDKAALEIKMSSMQEQFADINRQLEDAKKHHQTDRDHINKLNQQLSDYEGEIAMLRRTIESLETERSRDKANINRLQQEVDKLRIDLNNETLAHLDAENRRQTLEEEMEFMKKVHEQELKELAALAYRDTTAENREFWKSELAQAIRDIQQEYDAKVDQLRGDMEGFYNLKIQEYRTGATKQNMEVTHIREENKKLTKTISDLRGKLADLEARNAQLEKQYQELMRDFDAKDGDHMMEVTQLREEISKLRAEMEGILTELQTLMDAKLSLELEISAYRKLLEGEENRVDWRSRASLIKYRDAFRNARAADHTTEIKTGAVTSQQKSEQEINGQEASSDTGTASSVTTSEPGISPRGDELDSCSNKVVSGDGRITAKFDDNIESQTEPVRHDYPISETTEKEKIQPTHSEPQEEESIIKVKDEVRKIENKVANGTVDLTQHQTIDVVDGKKSAEHIGDKTKVNEHEVTQLGETDVTEEPISMAVDQKVTDAVHRRQEVPQTKQEDTGEDDKNMSEAQLEEKATNDIKESLGEEAHVVLKDNQDNLSVRTDSEKDEPYAEEKTDDGKDVGQENVSDLKKEKQLTPEKPKHVADSEISSLPSSTVDIKSNELRKNEAESKLNAEKSSDLKIEMQLSAEKQSPFVETEISGLGSSTNASKTDIVEETKIEKTEDKVLESKMPIEATEEATKTISETATVALSPTKEKPQVIDDLKQKSSQHTTSNMTDDIEEKIKIEEKRDLMLQNEFGGINIKPAETKISEKRTDEVHGEEDSFSPDKSAAELTSASFLQNKLSEEFKENTSKTDMENDNHSPLKDVKEFKSNSLVQKPSEEIKEITYDKDQEKDSISPVENEKELTSLSQRKLSEEIKEITDVNDQGRDKFSPVKTETELEPSLSHREPTEKLKEVTELNDQKKDSLSSVKGEEAFTSTLQSQNKSPDELKEIAEPKDHDQNVTTGNASINFIETSTIHETKNITHDLQHGNSLENGQSSEQLVKDAKNIEAVESEIQKKSEDRENSAEQKPQENKLLHSSAEPSIEKIAIDIDFDNQISPGDSKLADDKSKETVINSTTENEKKLNQNEQVDTDITKLESKSNVSFTNEKEKDVIEPKHGHEKVNEISNGAESASKNAPEATADSLDISDNTEKEETEKSINENILTGNMPKTDDENEKLHEIVKSSEHDYVKEIEREDSELDRDTVTTDKEIKSNLESSENHHEFITQNKEIKHASDDSVHDSEGSLHQHHKTETQSEGTVMEKKDKMDSMVADMTDKDFEQSQSVEEDFISQGESSLTDSRTLSGDTALELSETSLHTEGNGDLQHKMDLKTFEEEQQNAEPKLKQSATVEEEKAVKSASDDKTSKALPGHTDNSLPLTNGVLESPTEETSDVVPGSSDGDDTQMSMKMMRGEVSAKTTYQRTSTGPVAISEVDTEGKYITLENTSSGPNRRDVNLDGWKLKRIVDGKRDYVYPFRNFTLKAGKSVKILARKAAGQAGLNDLVFRDEDNWGVGSQVTTSLINDKDEEKATHVQKTLYN